EELGAPCSVADDCLSGLCIDGVCCDSECGGGDPGDCQACSQAAGAPTDGTCGLVGAASVCRPPIDSFDPPEFCTGVDPVCPADVNDSVVPRGSGGGISCTQSSQPIGVGSGGVFLFLLAILFVRRSCARERAPCARKTSSI